MQYASAIVFICLEQFLFNRHPAKLERLAFLYTAADSKINT